ncbi:MAG: Ig-like domain-containing protein [Gemmatimonadaceae bacterium]|nr:Ig-like domain-containing protein [Gemmatimonadaceae bacterium]
MRRGWLLTAGIIVGCGGGSETAVTPPPVAVATVTITESSIPTLLVGSSVQLTATARDAQNNALPARPIAWSSSAPSIASVSATGLVTGVAPGAAQVRATADGKFAEVAVTVLPPIEYWTLHRLKMGHDSAGRV